MTSSSPSSSSHPFSLLLPVTSLAASSMMAFTPPPSNLVASLFTRFISFLPVYAKRWRVHACRRVFSTEREKKRQASLRKCAVDEALLYVRLKYAILETLLVLLPEVKHKSARVRYIGCSLRVQRRGWSKLTRRLPRNVHPIGCSHSNGARRILLKAVEKRNRNFRNSKRRAWSHSRRLPPGKS